MKTGITVKEFLDIHVKIGDFITFEENEEFAKMAYKKIYGGPATNKNKK